MATKAVIPALAAALAVAVTLEAQEQAKERWRAVWAEGFESGQLGAGVAAPWKQRHKQRQVEVSDKAAAAGKHAARFVYQVSSDGSLDAERGAFHIEAPIPRDTEPKLGTWRISAALRFHPIAWTAASFRLRGTHWRAALAIINSGNLLYVGGEAGFPVWNVAKPDKWYRVRVTIQEEGATADLKAWEDGAAHKNCFYAIPLPASSLPIRYISFGYCGALVRYGQGRQAYIDDVLVERKE